MKKPAQPGHLKDGGKLMLHRRDSFVKAGLKSRGAKAFRETPVPKDPWGRK